MDYDKLQKISFREIDHIDDLNHKLHFLWELLDKMTRFPKFSHKYKEVQESFHAIHTYFHERIIEIEEKRMEELRKLK